MYTDVNEAREFLMAKLDPGKSLPEDKFMAQVDQIVECIPPTSKFMYGEMQVLQAANFYEVYTKNFKVGNNLVTQPSNEIAHAGKQSTHKVLGNDFQVLEFQLGPDESVFASPGSMLYMDGGISLQTKMGGIGKALKRTFSGESAFLTEYKNVTTERKTIALASGFPGAIQALDLSKIGSVLCQRGGFLASVNPADISIATTGVGAGFFGGNGFILQKIVSDNVVYVFAGGSIIEKELKAGQELQVDTGALVAFEPTVHYTVERVKGLSNVLWGREGFFNVKLVGPGKVYVQSLPLATFANNLYAMTPQAQQAKREASSDLLSAVVKAAAN